MTHSRHPAMAEIIAIIVSPMQSKIPSMQEQTQLRVQASISLHAQWELMYVPHIGGEEECRGD